MTTRTKKILILYLIGVAAGLVLVVCLVGLFAGKLFQSTTWRKTDFTAEDTAAIADYFHLPGEDLHIVYLEATLTLQDSSATMVFDTDAADLDAFLLAMADEYPPVTGTSGTGMTADELYQAVKFKQSDLDSTITRGSVIKGRMQWQLFACPPGEVIYDLLKEKGEVVETK